MQSCSASTAAWVPRCASESDRPNQLELSMSRKNKVNPDHYKVAGRLSPDDLARERMKQSAPRPPAPGTNGRDNRRGWTIAPPALRPTQARTPRLQGRVRRGGRLASGVSQKAAPRRKRRNRPRAGGRRLSPGGLPPRSRRGTRRRARTRRQLSGGGKRPGECEMLRV